MTRTHSILFLLIISLTVIGANGTTAQVVSESQASQETEIENLRLLEPTFGTNLGYVENDTTPGGGKYLCGGMSASSARSAATVVGSALGKLPASARERIRLKYIILCSRALASGQPIGGIPVPPLTLLMLNIGEAAKGENIVLHELYHLIEYKFNSFDDPEWQRRFGTSYANSYSGRLKQSPIGGGKRGFLNAYSETFAHEERADYSPSCSSMLGKSLHILKPLAMIFSKRKLYF